MSENVPVVYVVDDDDSFRTALARQLKVAGYRVKGYRGAGDFLLERYEEGPGCVLLDLALEGPSGLDLQEAIVRRGDAFPVIFLTGQGDVPQSVRAMRQGAVNFLTKPVKWKELLAAVAEALGRQSDEAGDRRRRQDLAERYARLSPREREVFEHVAAGLLNRQIAALLGISERTVKAHRAQIMEKMKVASLAELGQAAARLRDRGRAIAPQA